MIALLRLAVLGFVFLTVVYLAVAAYSRSLRREALEAEWAETAPEGASAAERDAYISKGLSDYHKSLRRKLIVLVYIVPPVLVGLLIYLMNFE